MSFTANRVYSLQTGKNYNPSTNGNTVYKFKGEVVEGAADIKVTSGNGVFARMAAIVAAGGTPTIIGGIGFRDPITLSTRIPVAGVAPLMTTGALLSPISGTYEFMLFDGDIPSSNDSPILSFHVIDNSAPFSFVTLSGDTVSFGGSPEIITGAVYNYGVQEVLAIGAPGDILGLAPAIKPGFF
jgi:hypothetical protein